MRNCCQNSPLAASLAPFPHLLCCTHRYWDTVSQQHREKGKGSNKIQAHSLLFFFFLNLAVEKNIYLFLCNQLLSQSSLSEPHSSVHNHRRTSEPACHFADKLKLHTQGHVLLSEARVLEFTAFDIQTNSVLCSKLDPARNDTTITNRKLDPWLFSHMILTMYFVHHKTH